MTLTNGQKRALIEALDRPSQSRLYVGPNPESLGALVSRYGTEWELTSAGVLLAEAYKRETRLLHALSFVAGFSRNRWPWILRSAVARVIDGEAFSGYEPLDTLLGAPPEVSHPDSGGES